MSDRATPEARPPSVDSLLSDPAGVELIERYGRPLVVHLVRDVLRPASDGGDTMPPTDARRIMAVVAERAAAVTAGPRPVINATGVLLHTGLGRAPLAAASVAHPGDGETFPGYTDLEVDLGSGKRGRRTWRAETMLCATTGADAAVVVNNGAAALLLAVAALAAGREVAVSRGELIEIGGEFRLPDIIGSSGARLVEVGTTNRTRTADFERAISATTGAILKAHTSNFRIVGFTASPSVGDLAAVARRADIPLIFDAGSGMLQRLPELPADEPAIDESLDAGADLVLFSGDKLLGGPQAGIAVGRADLIERMRHHPLARTMRVDKARVAAIDDHLAQVCAGSDARIPLRRMLATPPDELRARAERLAAAIGGQSASVGVIATRAVVGGGTAPGTELDSWGVRIEIDEAQRAARSLRIGRPAVFCKVEAGAIVLDVRAVGDDEVDDLAAAVKAALDG